MKLHPRVRGFFTNLWSRIAALFRPSLYPWEVMRQAGQKPAVQGFIPYFFAPDMEARMRHAERATERWFQEFCASLADRVGKAYRRPAFRQRRDTDLEFKHPGHRHAARRRKRAKEAIEVHGRVQVRHERKKWRLVHQLKVHFQQRQREMKERAYFAGKVVDTDRLAVL